MSNAQSQSSSTTTAANSPSYQCRHVHTGGLRCGSRCLRQQDFCYYHHTTRRPKSVLEAAAQATRLSRHETRNAARNAAFDLPDPEDRSAIQHSIGEVLRRIAANTLDPRRAGLLLYGLQIASLNLAKESRKPLESYDSPEPGIDTVDEIVDDPTFGPLAPVAEFAARPHAKSLEEILMEQWAKDCSEEEEIERRAARTLESLKRQAAAESFPLPATITLSAAADEQSTTPESRPKPLSVFTRSVQDGAKHISSHKLALRDSTRRHKWTGPQAVSAAI